MAGEAPISNGKSKYLGAVLVILVFFAYYFANPQSGSFYDYTFRIADALLHGKLGLEESPPQWLNEMIPLNGKYYSAFPLGSVLTILPLAIFKLLRPGQSFPGVLLAALLASTTTLFFFLLSGRYHDNLYRRLILTLLPVLGTWMWANLAFAGAWHIALGFAVLGQLAALYFILVKFNPFLAGLSFAVAFGNRTELLLLAPIFFYLIYRSCSSGQVSGLNFHKAVDRFVAIPIALGVATLLYNYARFNSFFDFGYARIPGVLEEPWYQHGIFSIYAIPGNAYAMLIEPWEHIPKFPYLVPAGFGGSILISCPFLVFLFRLGAKDATLKLLAWAAIGILTLVLWLHGNPGGWQISYRYAMELLPWIFLILLENSPKKVTPLELILFLASVAINAYSTWVFLYTNYMHPGYQQAQ
jgi:hypothetical protein